MDVEGFEVNVIRGLSKYLNKTVLLVEVRVETKEDLFCFHIDSADDIVIHHYNEIFGFENLIFKRELYNKMHNVNTHIGPSFSFHNRIARLAWNTVAATLFRLSPIP